MKKRLFIAIDISDEARQVVTDYILKFPERDPAISVKWERPEKLHLTLKFLGSTDDNSVRHIRDIVEQQAHIVAPFDVTISGTGAFPSAIQPRILWLGINEPTGKMKQLAAMLDEKCAKLGFRQERKSFKPHLTIARVSEPRTGKDLGKAHVEKEFGPVTFFCTDISLYESQLLHRGSVHTKLHTAALHG